jgi:hypothetical protein
MMQLSYEQPVPALSFSSITLTVRAHLCSNLDDTNFVLNIHLT